MNTRNAAYEVSDLKALESLYGLPSAASLKKEVDYIHPYYRKLIEVSPFVVVATNGPQGPDASPRGDPAGFVHIHDEKTILVPDRRGNNRIDSLRNLIHDQRIALLFLIPGVGETLRVNGVAVISTDPKLLHQFSVNGKPPVTVLIIEVKRVFFQCSRALLRSSLWDVGRHVERSSLPSVGAMLEALSNAEIDGTKYDEELPERVQKTMY